jgi:hypothetical protein
MRKGDGRRGGGGEEEKEYRMGRGGLREEWERKESEEMA